MFKAASANFLHMRVKVDRLGIQSDAFALAKAGLIPTHEVRCTLIAYWDLKRFYFGNLTWDYVSKVLSLLEAYENEKDYTIWSDISTNLDSITSVWYAKWNTTQIHGDIFLENTVTNLPSIVFLTIGQESQISIICRNWSRSCSGQLLLSLVGKNLWVGDSGASFILSHRLLFL